MRGHMLVGIGILYAMVIVGLISAKLAGHIAWAWWIVLLPIWAPIALVIVVAMIAIACFTDSTANGGNPFR